MEWVKKDIPMIQANVNGIKKNGSKILSIQTDEELLNADLYISTLPLKSCFPEMSEDLNYVGNIVVAIKLKDGPILPHGVGSVYFPNKYGFKRLTEYPAMTDPSYPNLENGTLISFEYNVFPWEKNQLTEKDYIEETTIACKELCNQEPLSTSLQIWSIFLPVNSLTRSKDISMQSFIFTYLKFPNRPVIKKFSYLATCS